MPLLSTFGAASARGFGNLSGIALPSDSLFNTVSFLSHFDGTNNGVNNVFDDSSSSNHTITPSGQVTQGSFSPFARPDGEWGVSFDDSTAYAQATGAGNFSGDYTYEVFVNVPFDNYTIRVTANANGNLNALNIEKDGVSGTNNFVFGTSSTDAQTTTHFSDLVFSSNTWHHVALVRSGSTVKCYLDGTASSVTLSNSSATGAMEYIGTARSFTSGFRLFNGFMSNVRFSDTARYTSNFTPPTAPFTSDANTDLLTAQSNRFADNSSNGRSITTYGNLAISAFGPFLTSKVYDAAVNGASAYFDGSDKLSSSASTDYEFGTGDLTVEYWAYPTASGGNQNILDNRAEASGWKVGRDASNRFQVYNEVTSSYLFESGNFPKNAWSHFCWTRASGVNKFFINGVQSGSNVSDSSNFDSNSLNIGVQHGGTIQYFTGYITCCRVIKGTAVEPLGVPSAPPTAVTNTKLLLNMADGQAIDSAAQNNLTLFGNAKISSTQSKFGGTSMFFGASQNDKVDLGSPFLDNGNWTCEFWIYLNTGSDITRIILGQYLVVDGRCIFQFLGASNEIQFFIGGTGGLSTLKASMSRTAWHHVAVTKNGDDYKLFVDGSVGATGTATVDLYTGVNTHLGPHNFTGDKGIDGYIDDLRCSNSIRYTSAFTPPTEPFADKGR